MKKILIVEDERQYLKLLHDQLAQKDYEIMEAKDGKEGLEMARRERPDLILLDLRMPVMDGLTMLDLLRRDEGGRSAIVIILTNLEPDDTIIRDVIKYQPAYYCVKSDMKFSELKEKAQELLVG